MLTKNERKYKINYVNLNGEEVLKVALKVYKEEVAVGYFRRVINDDIVTYEYLNK